MSIEVLRPALLAISVWVEVEAATESCPDFYRQTCAGELRLLEDLVDPSAKLLPGEARFIARKLIRHVRHWLSLGNPPDPEIVLRHRASVFMSDEELMFLAMYINRPRQ